MAYKFQFGTTKLSGSTTFEEALVGSSTISGSGLVSGKGLVLDSVSTIGTSDDSDLLTLSANTLAVAGALSASGQVDLPGAVRFGTENQLTVTAVGLLSGSATATLANATLDRITAGTADINGGTLDDTIIGGATAAAGTFSVLTATSIGGALDCDNQNFTNVDIDSGAIDGTTVGASSQSSVKATTLSASSTLHVAGASNLGVEAQTTVSAVGVLSSSATATLANATLDQITVGSADINGGAVDGAIIGANSAVAGTFSVLTATSLGGALDCDNQNLTNVDIDSGAIDGTTVGASSQSSVKATTLSASSTLHVAGASNLGVEAQTTVSAVGVLSSSATATLANATLDRITVGDADINGGAIDGTTIGASSQSSVKATTLSASSTLHVAGASNLGVEAQTTVSAVGLLSSSATATLANATFDRITAQTLLGDMSGSGGLDLMGAASFGNARLVVNENALLFTGPVHVSGTAFAEENITVANVADSKSRLAFYDIDSGEMKTTDFKVYADVLAGTGITATAGVLSVDTTGGDSMSATHITLANYGNATLTSGLNYMTSAVTGAAVLKLPSGSAGDVVVVKAPSGVTSTNYVKITSSLNKNEIDGFSQAVIESEYGAVSLMWAESDGKWIIY